jgi:hypothetical protein
MYQLLVYFPEQRDAHAIVNAHNASDALALIPRILADHHGCERVVVIMGTVRLFAVDCAGNRTP